MTMESGRTNLVRAMADLWESSDQNVRAAIETMQYCGEDLKAELARREGLREVARGRERQSVDG